MGIFDLLVMMGIRERMAILVCDAPSCLAISVISTYGSCYLHSKYFKIFKLAK